MGKMRVRVGQNQALEMGYSVLGMGFIYCILYWEWGGAWITGSKDHTV